MIPWDGFRTRAITTKTERLNGDLNFQREKACTNKGGRQFEFCTLSSNTGPREYIDTALVN